jgi:hypothetical protein
MLEIDLLERDSRASSRGNHRREEVGLKAMVIGVVVLLAQKHEIRALEHCRKIVELDFARPSDGMDRARKNVIARDR